MRDLSELINEEKITEIEIEIKTTPEKAKEIMNAVHYGEIKLSLDKLYCKKCSNEATLSENEIKLRLIKGNVHGIRTLGEFML